MCPSQRHSNDIYAALWIGPQWDRASHSVSSTIKPTRHDRRQHSYRHGMAGRSQPTHDTIGGQALCSTSPVAVGLVAGPAASVGVGG